MRAIDGRLPVNKEYRFICALKGIHNCDNCGTPITNIAVVQDSDGKYYRIGMECLETFLNLHPSDIYQAKKEFRLLQKFIKVLKTTPKITFKKKYPDCAFILAPNGNLWRCSIEKLKQYYSFVNSNAEIIEEE